MWIRSFLLFGFVTTCLAIAVAENRDNAKLDRTKKRLVEKPTRDLVQTTSEVKVKKPKKTDLTKSFVIEAPTRILANYRRLALPAPTLPVPPKVDQTKRDTIELTTHQVVNSSAEKPSDKAKKFKNPKVAPGAVRWHANFEAACAASRKSGKPVLLFQMMGNLDDQFC